MFAMPLVKPAKHTFVPREEIRAFPVFSTLGRQEYPSYSLRRSGRRHNLALNINREGNIIVHAPLHLAQADIDHFLQKHTAWIETRLADAQTRVFEWRGGAELPWRGGVLKLVLLPPAAKPVPRHEENCLFCPSNPEAIAGVVTQWYRHQARALLAERLALHAARARLSVPILRVSDARTRWGSLSSKDVVSLNWRLLKASPVELDYVVCHELAHFRQRNHSPAFWREVAALFADYAGVRATLRSQAERYFAF
jgi:hypothetical protein